MLEYRVRNAKRIVVLQAQLCDDFYFRNTLGFLFRRSSGRSTQERFMAVEFALRKYLRTCGRCYILPPLFEV